MVWHSWLKNVPTRKSVGMFLMATFRVGKRFGFYQADLDEESFEKNF